METTSTFEFFVPYQRLAQEIIKALENGSEPHKGILVTIKVKHDAVANRLNADAQIEAVQGILSASGAVPVVAGTSRSMCPHPPPCS